MRFKIEGITEEELDYILNKDNIKNSIYNNKKTTTTDCVCSSNTTLCKENIKRDIELKSILLNNNYIDLLYILLEKRFLYQNELLRFKKNNWKHYLDTLLSLRVIEIKDVEDEIKDFLLFTKSLNKGTIKQAKFFKLTSDAALEYGQDILKDYIRREASNNVISFVEEQKQLFTKSKEEIRAQLINEELRLKAELRRLNIEEC